MVFMIKVDETSMNQNGLDSGTKISKIMIEMDSSHAILLSKLGYVHETPSELIKKLVEHAYVCDRFLLERDEDCET